MFIKVLFFFILVSLNSISTEELTTIQSKIETNPNLENDIYKFNLDKETSKVSKEDNEKQIVFQTQSTLNNDDEIKKIDFTNQNDLTVKNEEIPVKNSDFKDKQKEQNSINLEESKNNESNSINEPNKENSNTELPINIDSSLVFEIQTISPVNTIENKDYSERNLLKNNKKNEIFVYSNLPKQENSIILNSNDKKNSNWYYPVIKNLPNQINNDFKNDYSDEIDLSKNEKISEDSIEKSKNIIQKDYVEVTTIYPIVKRFPRGVADVLFPNGVGHEIGHFRDHLVDYVGKRLTAVSSQRIYVHHKYHHEPNHLAKLPIIGPYLDENRKKKPVRSYRKIQ